MDDSVGISAGNKPHSIAGSDSYLCHYTTCNKNFSNPYQLKIHLKLHQQNLYQCEWKNCDKSFKHIDLLIRHRKSHVFICPKCGNAFHDLEQMKEHDDKQHSDIFSQVYKPIEHINIQAITQVKVIPLKSKINDVEKSRSSILKNTVLLKGFNYDSSKSYRESDSEATDNVLMSAAEDNRPDDSLLANKVDKNTSQPDVTDCQSDDSTTCEVDFMPNTEINNIKNGKNTTSTDLNNRESCKCRYCLEKIIVNGYSYHSCYFCNWSHCNKSFSHESARHRRIHTDIMCIDCDRRFKKKHNLTKHKNLVHGDKNKSKDKRRRRSEDISEDKSENKSEDKSRDDSSPAVQSATANSICKEEKMDQVEEDDLSKDDGPESILKRLLMNKSYTPIQSDNCDNR